MGRNFTTNQREQHKIHHLTPGFVYVRGGSWLNSSLLRPETWRSGPGTPSFAHETDSPDHEPDHLDHETDGLHHYPLHLAHEPLRADHDPGRAYRDTEGIARATGQRCALPFDCNARSRGLR